MSIKPLLKRGIGALITLPLIPSLAQAVQLSPVPPSTRTYAHPPHINAAELLHEVLWEITIIGIVMSVIMVYFLIAYRRKSPGEVGKPTILSPQATLGWLIIPVGLFLADDIYLFARGIELHNQYRQVPTDAYEIKVSGMMWSWSYAYPGGVESYGELRVPVNTPILLRMSSYDLIHSHFLHKYRVTEDLMPGRVTYQWFLPDEIGESVVTCREYCGIGHSNMYGKVIVMAKSEFDGWLASEAGKVSSAEEAASHATAIAEAAHLAANKPTI